MSRMVATKSKGPSKPRGTPRQPPTDRQDYAIALGKLIELARETRGMTRKELAESLGVSAATVSRFEAGQTLPNAMVLAKLAEALKLPPSAFNEVVSSVDWKKFATAAGLGAAWLLGPVGGVLGMAVRAGIIGAAVAAASKKYLGNDADED